MNPFGDEEIASSATGNPFGDEAVQEPGMLTAAKRGFQASKMGYQAADMEGSARMLGKLEQLEREGDSPAVQQMAKDDLMFSNHYRLWKFKGQDPAVLAQLKQQSLERMKGSSEKLQEGAVKSAALPASPEVQEFQDTTDWAGAFSKLAKAPFRIMGETVASSVGSQALTLPLTVAAGVTMGPAGVAAVQGGSSFMQEAGSGTLELLMKSGVDINDPAAVSAFMNSPEFKLNHAAKLRKAAAIGAFDAAAGGIAGVKLGSTIPKNLAAQTGVQMSAGGLGEITGATFGDEEINPAAVISEVIGEVPGAGVDVGSVALGSALRNKSIEDAAAAKEAEAMTGAAPAQQDTINEVKGDSKKPRLTALQSQIVVASGMAGVDPGTALAIASIETGGRFDPQAKNPNSSAHGLFQQLDSNWNETGGGDRNDIHTQIKNGLASIAGTQQAMENLIGHKPSTAETYMGHLLGPRGGAATITAARNNPDGAFIDTVRGWDKKNAEAIVGNNGLTGLTNSQAANKIASWVTQHQRKLGMDDQANKVTKAFSHSDEAPTPDGKSVEDSMDEIDAILAEIEAKPPTPEEIAEAKLEEGELAAPPQAEALMQAAELEDGVEVVAPTLVPEPMLPADLAGAAPRYGFANQNFEVKFSSDVDRAAYIVANTAKRSSRDADYLKFLMDATGMTDVEARAYGNEVRGAVKEKARAARGTETTSIEMGTLVRSDSGVSLAEQETRYNTPNPNDRVKLSSLPIIAGGEAGFTLNQQAIQPGQVVAVGLDSEQTPLGYMQAVQGTLQQVISRFAPTARVALSFKTGEEGTISSYQQKGQIGKSYRAGRQTTGLYHINMRNAKNLGVSVDGTRNPTTQWKITYAAYHEVGHVIADHRMTERMQPETLLKFRASGQEALNATFDDLDFMTLSPQQAAVLQEYNVLKDNVLNNPEFTTEAFMSQWLSPWKLAHGWGDRQGMISFLKKFYGETAVLQLTRPAREFALTLHQYSDILSPHEYMAEQMARYAYSNKLAEGSPLGVLQFFQQALESLRAFFQQLKRGGDIKPGIAFAEWVDSLTQTTQVFNDSLKNKAVPAETKVTKKPRLKLKTTPKVESLPESLLPPPETLETVIAVTPMAVPQEVVMARQLLRTDPVLQDLRVSQPEIYAELSELAKLGRIEEFKYEVQQYVSDDVADKMRWDTDNPEHMEWRQVEQQMSRALPKRAGLKRWLGHGLRYLSDRKYFVMNLRQMAFAYPEVGGLQSLDMLMTSYKAHKAKLEFRGLEAAQEWSKLGKEQHGLLEQALREEHASGEHLAELQVVNKTWRFMPSEKLRQFATSKKLDEATVKVWLDVKNAHLQHMNSLENVMRQKIVARFQGRPKTTRVKLAELHQIFQSIRSTPFIPQTRFGEFALHVKEEGQIVHVEFFETKAARDEALGQLQKIAGKERKVSLAHYSLTSGILRTLPPQILSTYAEEFQLTAKERKELREIADVVTRNPQTRKYSSQLAQVTGANKNLLRNFADFIWHDSNNIAKLSHTGLFRSGVRQIAEDMRGAAEVGDVAWHDELQKLYDFSSSYVNHILNPADEWHMVRAFVVVKQLWGNIKTALANITSMQQLWALSAKQQGLVKGTFESNRTMLKVLGEGIMTAGQKILRQPVEGGQVFSEEERWAMNQAKVNGLLDESFAAQLATFANHGTLSRLNFETGESWAKKILWAGMLPQHVVESFTRRVTLLNQFNNYVRQGDAKEVAYAKAEKDVHLLQGDNTILNRPAFMRGKVAAFTIYYGYMQNMIYLLSGAQERARNYRAALASGKADELTREQARAKFFKTSLSGETLKIWMGYAMLGGLMGLPGAEDLDKVLELVSAKLFGSRFSLKEHAYKMAAAVSETAADFGMDIAPRSIVHGNASDVFGFDLSPSVGLGNALPGFGGVDKLGDRGGLGDFLTGAMGPVGQIVKQFNDVFSDDPSMLKKTALFLPSTATNIARTFHEWENGVLYPSGGKVTVDLTTGEVRDLTTGENLARLAGFPPSIITANKELHWMQKDAAAYWTSRRNGLVTQMWEAVRQDDREAIADVGKAIEAFNEQAPGHVAISGKELKNSLKRRGRGAAQDEAGVARQKQFRGLFEEMEGDFRGGQER